MKMGGWRGHCEGIRTKGREAAQDVRKVVKKACAENAFKCLSLSLKLLGLHSKISRWHSASLKSSVKGT